MNDLQMRAIMMAVQRELEAGSTPPIHLEGAPNPTPKVPANQALLRLYDYLHTMAQHLQLELVHTQVCFLLRHLEL